MSDIVFPKGLSVKAPHEKAPDFVKGSISIKKEVFLDWLSHQQGEWVNLDIKTSKKDGKYYAQVNDWKAENKAPVDTGFSTPPPAYDKDDLPF